MKTGNMFTRVGGATVLGATVTALVLWLMQSLIESDQAAPEALPPGATLTFLPLIEEKPAGPDDRKPQPPPDPDTPPPPPKVVRNQGDGPVIGTDFPAPVLDKPGGPQRGMLTDGDALPVVKVNPVYPDSAISRGIEGHVLVQFTIDSLGRVTDATVLEAKPRGVFERAALHAVERFRYKPRVVNGAAIPVSGVRHLVTFELDS